jgi:hypothetical protein
MPVPNAVQNRWRDRVDQGQRGDHRGNDDDESDDPQSLGFQNFPTEGVAKLGRQRLPRPALKEAADKGLHGARQSASD